ncbi:MAG TPA: Gfo/Idh/MocA family oxidoreductase [Caldilineaceae bacterium]|nr:Gfo/Idh/MocA family oxidoreductase [Caldilineaceae bacterium]
MSDTTRTKIGIIGCGNISGIYLKSDKVFDNLQIVGCADIDMARAQARAAEYGIRAYSIGDLLADPAIELVVNLTIPAAHAEVAAQALNAGKATYSEKPFALTRADGRQLLDLAGRKGLPIGCAPDTFLGGGLQTCRKLVDDGAIGEPVAATAFMMSHGHENWHPNPEFYYKAGGGPLFDMGPYYLTPLVPIIGPVRRVAGMTRITFPERLVTSQPLAGQRITVEVPTHVAGLLEFANGAIGTIIQTFDVWGANLPRLEIYGTEGSLSLPDPNTFGGPVRIRLKGKNEWEEVTLSHIYTENSRGLGVADMAAARKTGRPHRASGELAYHVLDIMQAIHEASEQQGQIELTSSCARPAMLPVGLKPGAVER